MLTSMQASFAFFGRNDVIYDEFGAGDVGCAGGLISGIINEIDPDCHRVAIGFFILGADGADKMGVNRALSGWYLRLTDEKQVFVTLILP